MAEIEESKITDITGGSELDKMDARAKAAVVVVSLGADRASQIYKYLSEQEIEDLTYEVAKLGKTNNAQVENALDEFYKMCLTHKMMTDGGLDYARSVLEKAFGETTARNLLEDASSVTDSPDTSPPSENPIASKPESPGRKSSRKPLPAELPRETHRLLPAETSCPACGGVLKEMGETISEQLDIINTAFKVIETIRPKLACSRCDVIVQAPLPPKPIERGYASAGLLARILVSK